MSTDFRALCAELAAELDHNRRCLLDDASVTHPLADRARAELAKPADAPATVAERPSNEELGLIYHDCCRGCEFMDQGGFEDAARVVLARWGNLTAGLTGSPAEGEVAELVRWLRENAEDERQMSEATTRASLMLDRVAELLARGAAPVPAETLAARPLIEQVAAMGDCIGQQTVGQIMSLASRAASWLAENPPGQPVAIEPRGCPTPGACSCLEPAQAEPADAPAALPVDFIDPEHSGTNREMLEEFYAATFCEGGTDDVITLRGINAVLARWGQLPAPPAEGEVAELAEALRGDLAEPWRGLHGETALTRAAELLERHAVPVPVPVSERLPQRIEQALIKAECALSDIAEGEAEESEGDPLKWVETRAAGALARIRPVMRQHQIQTSEWPPLPASALPLPSAEVQP